jgi:hypothetical protein
VEPTGVSIASTANSSSGSTATNSDSVSRLTHRKSGKHDKASGSTATTPSSGTATASSD